jgi:glyoxylase-like metal-dependent hydrolase (beta-lactamase superfamily II)
MIYNLGGFARNGWVIEAPGGLIAVDTGMPGGFGRFLRGFEERWALSSLKAVFLTHAHIDHAGFLADLLNNTGAEAIVSSAAPPLLAAGFARESHQYRNWFGVVLDMLTAVQGGRFPLVGASGRITAAEDGDAPFDKLGVRSEVLALPGHTPDSAGLFLPDMGALFCGDAAMNRLPFNANLHCAIVNDIKRCQESWDRIITLNPALVYPGHGKPFKPNELKKHRNYLSGRG